jgi:hypothetical protein
MQLIAYNRRVAERAQGCKDTGAYSISYLTLWGSTSLAVSSFAKHPVAEVEWGAAPQDSPIQFSHLAQDPRTLAAKRIGPRASWCFPKILVQPDVPIGQRDWNEKAGSSYTCFIVYDEHKVLRTQRCKRRNRPCLTIAHSSLDWTWEISTPI